MKKFSSNSKISSSKTAPIGYWLAVLLIGIGIHLPAQSIDLQAALPVDTTVRTGVLANGLQYFLYPNQEPRKRAELRLVVKAGSLQEEEDQLGVAHFVEHMAFNGTRKFAQNTLIDFIERNGSSFGADLNAYTTFARTVYQLEVMTDSLMLVDTALQILAEWADQVSFAPEEIERERGVIRSEWRSGLSSNQRLQMQAYQVLLQGARYADRLPIGSPELIDTVARERLVDYYQRWYQPENMAVVVVGDVDLEWMTGKLEDYFSTLENRDFIPPAEYLLDTTPTRRYLLATDDEAPFTRWEVNFQLTKNGGSSTLGKFRKILMNSLFGALMNKLLADLREREVPPFTFAYSGFSSLPGDYRTYKLSGLGPVDQLDDALDAVFTETRRVVLYGFSPLELEREKKAIVKQFQQNARELDKRHNTSIAGALVASFLTKNPLPDDGALPATVEAVLATISNDDLQQLITEALRSPVQTGIITSHSDLVTQLPDSSAFYQRLDTLLQLQPAALPEVSAMGPLFEEDLTPNPSVLISKDTVLQVSGYRLSNGLRFYLKTTDFKNDEIRFQAFSPGGTSLYDDLDYPSARHAASIADQSGLDTFSVGQLLPLLSDRKATSNPYINAYEEGLSGSSNREDLELLFQLIYLNYTRPRFDSLALAGYRQRQIDIYERLDQDPRTAFGRMLIDKKYDGHPRRADGSIAEMEVIDLERAAAIYGERFADAADFQFVFVGNFAPDTLRQLAERYLGNLPTTGTTPEQWQDRGLRLHQTALDTTVIAGQTPKGEVILEWHGDFPYDDRTARFHFFALRELLNYRLRAKLREERGGVYDVRINLSTQTRPDSLHHTVIRFNAAPHEVDTLIDLVYAEIEQIAAGDVLQSDIEKLRATRLKRYEESLRSNRSWLARLGAVLRLGSDFSRLYPERYRTELEQIDPELLGEVARKYLLEATHFRFVLLPEG